MTTTLPNCAELEFEMIAYLASNGAEAGICYEELEPDDFYLEEANAIFIGMKSLYAKNKTIELAALSQELRDLRLYETASKERILQKAFAAMYPTSGEIDWYIEQIKSKSHARRLYFMSESLKTQSLQANADGFKLAEEFEKKILQMCKTKREKSAVWMKDLMAPMSEIIKERVKKAQEAPNSIPGTPSGLKDLDAILRGFKAGNLTIVGARPGIGKTSLLLNFLQNISFKEDKKIGFFSLEMPKEQVRDKLISQKTLIPFERIQDGTLTQKEIIEIDKAIAEWFTKLILMDDQSGLTMQQLKTRCYRLKDSDQLGMIMVDYLQLLRLSKRSNSKYEEVTEISKELKILAKECECPLICLAQLNREVENRPDQKPRKSDLRDSGSLEQDADEILLLHQDKENENIMHLIIDKNRSGKEGKIELYFDKATGKITDLAKTEKTTEKKSVYHEHWGE